MEKDFKSLGITDKIIEGLEKQGITTPTDIQSMVIPRFVEHIDIIAQSETGSGKTLAYLLPIFMRIETDNRHAQAIILTPTHELAVQVHKQSELLAENSGIGIRSALIIGGASILRQMEKLKEKPHIIVGSAGRILDLIEKRKLSVHNVKTIVIDEADRMLDSLNIDGVKAVINKTLRDRQLVLLSASIDNKTKAAASEIMKETEILKASTEEGLPENIRHIYIVAERREKIELVRKIIHAEKPEKAIVFLNNPENIEVTVEKLNFHALKAAGIYGAAYKTDRKNAMDDFREGRVKVLVASDIGARGLDIPGVTHIINLDISEEPVYYLHRAGRTGRKGEKGTAISVVTEYEKKWINKYERTFGIKFERKEVTFGKLEDIKVTNKEDKKAIIVKDNAVSKAPEKKAVEKPKKNKTEKLQAPKPRVLKKPKKKEENTKELGFFARKAEKLAKKLENKKK